MITRPHQVLLDGSLVLGDLGTLAIIGRPAGLYGSSAVRRASVPRGRSHGDRPTRATYGGRLVTLGVMPGTAEDESDARTDLQALFDAWLPPDGIGEQTLDFLVPGVSDRRFYGQCNGTPEQVSGDPTQGAMQVVAEFWAADPLVYARAASTQTLSGASASITSAGNMATDRATVTITGNGSAPVVTNSTDGRALTWATNLANGATRIVDLRDQTVTDAAGTSYDSEVVLTGPFPRMRAGAQTWTRSGCGDVIISWRDAWNV